MPIKDAAKEPIFDDRDIEERKKFVDLEPADLKRIFALREIVTRASDELADGFFDYLKRFEQAKTLFASATALEEARRLKKEHLLAMVSGEYDRRYIDQRIKLGRIYSRAGIDAKVFLGAFHHLMRSIGERIVAGSKGAPLKAFENFLALKKIAFLDLGVIVDILIFEREQTIRQQQEAIRELSTPVLQLRERLLILPIVGMIDTYRARLLTENLLRSIRDNRAKVVVIDITGVATVDSKVANHLVQTVTAARLMGARVLVTGLSAEIAQTLVTLGVELSKLNTSGDLQGGIEEAERWLGYRMIPIPETTAATH